MSDNEKKDLSPVIGGIEIKKNGSIFVKKSLAVNFTEDEISKFDLTIEFIIHALNRTDWMSDFIQKKIVRDQSIKKEELRKSLRLIQGGQSKEKN